MLPSKNKILRATSVILRTRNKKVKTTKAIKNKERRKKERREGG